MQYLHELRGRPPFLCQPRKKCSRSFDAVCYICDRILCLTKSIKIATWRSNFIFDLKYISQSATMSEKVYKDPRLALYIAESKFRKTWEQIKLITRRRDLLQIRYDKVKRDDMKSFRYTFSLQLATTEGSRNIRVCNPRCRTSTNTAEDETRMRRCSALLDDLKLHANGTMSAFFGTDQGCSTSLPCSHRPRQL